LDDVVVIAGKGESVQVRGTELPFSDVEVAQAAIQSRARIGL
jgi:hypothetical protein